MVVKYSSGGTDYDVIFGVALTDEHAAPITSGIDLAEIHLKNPIIISCSYCNTAYEAKIIKLPMMCMNCSAPITEKDMKKK
jgi:hypothetical protein